LRKKNTSGEPGKWGQSGRRGGVGREEKEGIKVLPVVLSGDQQKGDKASMKTLIGRERMGGGEGEGTSDGI